MRRWPHERCRSGHRQPGSVPVRDHRWWPPRRTELPPQRKPARPDPHRGPRGTRGPGHRGPPGDRRGRQAAPDAPALEFRGDLGVDQGEPVSAAVVAQFGEVATIGDLEPGRCLVVGDRNGIAHAAIVASGARRPGLVLVVTTARVGWWLGSGQAVRCHYLRRYHRATRAGPAAHPGVGCGGVTSDERWLAAVWPFVHRWLPAPPATVVEIGCGPPGGFVPMLRAAGYDASGVDPEAPDGPEYHRTEFERYQVPGPAAAVVACASLHH